MRQTFSVASYLTRVISLAHDAHMFAIERVATPGTDAANEPWLAFAPRQEVTITRLGEYTKVVLTKSGAEMPAMPQPVWA